MLRNAFVGDDDLSDDDESDGDDENGDNEKVREPTLIRQEEKQTLPPP